DAQVAREGRGPARVAHAPDLEKAESQRVDADEVPLRGVGVVVLHALRREGAGGRKEVGKLAERGDRDGPSRDDARLVDDPARRPDVLGERRVDDVPPDVEGELVEAEGR